MNAKCERAHLMRRNPRKITWTVLYRRQHKRGKEEEHTKRRARRVAKTQRAIVGASLTEILARRNQKPEVRKAQREQAVRAIKEKKRAEKKTKAKEKAPPAPPKKAVKSHKAPKQVMAKAPRVGGKR
ncbi:60S ribosomal protein L24, partial [Fragariocoptes setiger]